MNKPKCTTHLANKVKLRSVHAPIMDSYYGIAENLDEEEVRKNFSEELIKETEMLFAEIKKAQ